MVLKSLREQRVQSRGNLRLAIRLFLHFAFVVVAVMGLAVNGAAARSIGLRVWIQPWNPQRPSDDALKMYFDDPSILSATIADAWNKSRDGIATDFGIALQNYNLGGGFQTYNAGLALNPITGFKITRSGSDGAIVEFTIPNIVITTSFRVPDGLDRSVDPKFSLTESLVVKVQFQIGESGDLLRTASVSALVQGPDGGDLAKPVGLNDSAKAIIAAADSANAIFKFIVGFDLEQALIDVVASQDPAKQRLQPTIEKELGTINAQFQNIPGLDLLLARKVWADNDRLTLYVAPKPIPVFAVKTYGTMRGRIEWDAGDVAGNCSDVNISASVQLGPPPLMNSDGALNLPPTLTVGSFGVMAERTFADARVLNSPATACDYILSGLAIGLPNALRASTTFAAAVPNARTSPYGGSLYSSATILAEGWAGDFVMPNADGLNYRISSSRSGGSGIGQQRPRDEVQRPLPGDEKTVPGAANQIGPAVETGAKSNRIQSRSRTGGSSQ